METKHTKKYAEKMADSFAKTYGGGKSIFVAGYMEAIKQTAAPELLAALIDVKYGLEIAQLEETQMYKNVINAIKKAV